MNAAAEKASLEDLADELFLAVEKSQGYAFISDGEAALGTKERFFERQRGRLWYALAAAQKISQFLKKYDELDEPRKRGARR